MNKRRLVTSIFFGFIILVASAQNNKKDFFGMWTIEIKGGGVGWLGVNDNQGFLDAELLWRGGSVVPVSDVYFLDENTLVVTRTSERRKSETRVHTVTQTYKFTRDGDRFRGVLIEPEGSGMSIRKTQFRGWRLPDVGPAPDLSKIKYGEPIRLFNGKNLEGWSLMEKEKANGFKVINGELVNNPVAVGGKRLRYGNIRTDAEFKDFKLNIEVNVPTHSNSGVYLRGMYEIQVYDSYGKELDSHNMGALYSRLTPTQSAEKPGGQWQTMEIILCKRHVTVVLNGVKIIDNQPVYGPTGGAMQADVFQPGPIYLQGDHGKVSYRNIVLTPILD